MKTRTLRLSTILGLVLGVAGALGIVELRPQPSVSPLQMTEQSQPFSVPFTIQNGGYLPFYVERVFCYVYEVKTPRGEMNNNLIIFNTAWNGVSLDTGEGETIVCNFFHGPIPSKADIAIVLNYKPFLLFPWSLRKYFRFKGMYVNNWQWVEQPLNAIIKDGADKMINGIPKK